MPTDDPSAAVAADSGCLGPKFRAAAATPCPDCHHLCRAADSASPTISTGGGSAAQREPPGRRKRHGRDSTVVSSRIPLCTMSTSSSIAVPSVFRAVPTPLPTAAVAARTGQRHRVPFPNTHAAMAFRCNRTTPREKSIADVSGARQPQVGSASDRLGPLVLRHLSGPAFAAPRLQLGRRMWLRPAERPSRRALPSAVCSPTPPEAPPGGAWFEIATVIYERRRR